MKKFALSIGLVLFSLGLTFAQQKQDADIKVTPTQNLLEGVWAVEHNDMLPTHLKEDYRVFLKDSLFFGPTTTHTFGNNTKDKSANTYYYDDKSKQLVIYDATLKGVEYMVKSISQDQLIFSVPNVQLNNFIDLVYVRVVSTKEKD